MSISVSIMSDTELMVTVDGQDYHKIVDATGKNKKVYFNLDELVHISCSIATSEEVNNDFPAASKALAKVLFDGVGVPQRSHLVKGLLTFMKMWNKKCTADEECNADRPPPRLKTAASDAERVKQLIARLKKSEGELQSLKNVLPERRPLLSQDYKQDNQKDKSLGYQPPSFQPSSIKQEQNDEQERKIVETQRERMNARERWLVGY